MSGSQHSMPTLPNALSWADRAACRGYDLDLFFSDAAQKVLEAKAICGGCPVRATCLAEALRAEVTPRYGISGGLTPAERDELVAAQPTEPGVEPLKRTSRKLASCGSRSAYQRHVRKGEPIDPACRAANTAADNRLRRSGSTKVLR